MSSLPVLGTALVATFLVIAVIWYFAPRLLRRGRTDSQDPAVQAKHKEDADARAAVLPPLTAITVVGGLFISFYQFNQTQRTSVDRDTWSLFVESLKLINEKTDASTTAQRTGAIYALQDTMEKSPGFHRAALVTLISFLHAKRSRMVHPACRLLSVSSEPDVQAAIDVIGHRGTEWPDAEPYGVLNFQSLCLFGASFRGANLTGANFQQSDLRRTNFDGATLIGANLTVTDMDYQGSGATHDERTTAWFQQATGEQSYRFYELATLFRHATVTGAKFEGACLRGVDFTGSDLTVGTEDDGPDNHFADAGISLANFKDVTGLTGDPAFNGACFTQPLQNAPGVQNLACPTPVIGMTALPADALPEAAADRCNRDVFQLAPAADNPGEEDIWPPKVPDKGVQATVSSSATNTRESSGILAPTPPR